jgi:putative colanic acid biosynthesis UDP-glucose lipid carrier transferase
MTGIVKEHLKSILIIGDALSVTMFFLLYPWPIANNEMTLHIASIMFIWPMASMLTGTYGSNAALHFEVLFKTTAQSIIIWLFFLLISAIFIIESIHKLFIISHIGVFLIWILSARIIYLFIKYRVKQKRSENNKVIILGFNDTAKKLANYFEEEGLESELLGFIDDSSNITELSNYPILSPLEETIHTACALKAQEIYSTITPEQNSYIYSLIQEAEEKCMRFRIVPNLSHFVRKPVITSYIRDMPVISLRRDPLEDPSNRAKKRALDIFFSLFMLIFVISWLYPIIGLIIKLESKGPIIFSQLRTGLNDHSFKCYKFRSMKTGPFDETKQATKNDSRITKLGAILRKTSIDEFPQFINVIKGEMSIVGPRPHMMQHTEKFSKLVEHYMIRQMLKPGITGWAQVNGFRGEITETDQLKMRIANDLWYLENWNIWLDIKIILMTGFKIFSGDKHAY